jgi:hypothetical protein
MNLIACDCLEKLDLQNNIGRLQYKLCSELKQVHNLILVDYSQSEEEEWKKDA